jgi:hypothetical protein
MEENVLYEDKEEFAQLFVALIKSWHKRLID